MAIPRFPQGPFGSGDLDEKYVFDPPYPATPPAAGAQLGTAIPIVESGTGAAGTAVTGSHEDHVHPAAAAVSPGVVGDIVAETLPSAAAAGASGKYADAAHRHAIAAAGAPAAEALASTQVTGVAATFAASDHVHAMMGKSVAVPLVESGAGSAGTSNLPSLDDHVHPAAPGSSQVGCSVSGTSTVIGIGATASLAFNSADTFDTNGFHDPAVNNTLITIPATLGRIYTFTVTVINPSVDTDVGIGYSINGGATVEPVRNRLLAASALNGLQMIAVVQLAAGDTIAARVRSGSGATYTTYSAALVG